MLQTTFTTEFRCGPIPIGFPVHLEGNYITILGINGSGKTSLLNVLFQKNQGEKNEGKTQVSFIGNTGNISTSVPPNGRTLEQYNAELSKAIEENNGRDHTPNPNELPYLLLSHKDFIKQSQKLNYYLEYLRVPEYTIQETPYAFFTEQQRIRPGSEQYVLPILAALTDDYIKMILIDEPYLLARSQFHERLRDLLLDVSKKKQIIIATHSNTFINIKDHTSNYFITRKNDSVSISRSFSESQLEGISSAEIKLVKALAKSGSSIVPGLSTSLDIKEIYAEESGNMAQATKIIQEKHDEINITIFYEELKKSIKQNKDDIVTRYRERVQQTNIAYYVSLVCLIFSVLLVFIGIILIFIGKIEGGALKTVSSTISSIVSSLAFVFNKQANDQERGDSLQMRTLEKSYEAMGYISCMTDKKREMNS